MPGGGASLDLEAVSQRIWGFRCIEFAKAVDLDVVVDGDAVEI